MFISHLNGHQSPDDAHRSPGESALPVMFDTLRGDPFSKGFNELWPRKSMEIKPGSQASHAFVPTLPFHIMCSPTSNLIVTVCYRICQRSSLGSSRRPTILTAPATRSGDPWKRRRGSKKCLDRDIPTQRAKENKKCDYTSRCLCSRTHYIRRFAVKTAEVVLPSVPERSGSSVRWEEACTTVTGNGVDKRRDFYPIKFHKFSIDSLGYHRLRGAPVLRCIPRRPNLTSVQPCIQIFYE